MGEERLPGGYGNCSGPPNRNSNFGSDFISLGANEPSDGGHKQWRPRGGRGGQHRLLSGARNQGPYHGGPSRGGWNNRGSNQWGSNQHQPFHQRRGGSFRGGGFDHQRGNRNQRHQGHRSSDAVQDISSYYHPSMVEDPWLELENMFKVPQSSTQSDSLKDADCEKFKGDDDSEHSVHSDGSE